MNDDTKAAIGKIVAERKERGDEHDIGRKLSDEVNPATKVQPSVAGDTKAAIERWTAGETNAKDGWLIEHGNDGQTSGLQGWQARRIVNLHNATAERGEADTKRLRELLRIAFYGLDEFWETNHPDEVEAIAAAMKEGQ